MLSLGIDCSEFGISVALAEGTNLIMEQTTTNNQRASKSLIPQIQSLFVNQSKTLAEVQIVAVAQGPGSFTGLKIGVTAGKVLAAVNQAQLFGISSLANLAFPLLGTERPVLALLSARHHNFYAGIYQKKSEKIVNLLPDSYLNFGVLKEKLNSYQDLLIIGSGLATVTSELNQLGTIVHVESNNLMPRGFNAILLSQGQKAISPSDFVPNYIRDPQAVLVWEKNNPQQPKVNYVEEI